MHSHIPVSNASTIQYGLHPNSLQAHQEARFLVFQAKAYTTKSLFSDHRYTQLHPYYVIGQFRGDYYFLSNFYEASITYDGLTYKNAEAAFQAQKCLTEEEKRGFSELSPAAAKSRGRRVALRPDWEEVKVGLMEEIVYAKFIQNEDLKQMLLATGNALLKEGNVWNDLFWGVSLKSGRGKNTLGNILMRIRDNFRQEQKA